MSRSELVRLVGHFQAAAVAPGERPDQAAARSSQAVRQRLGYTPEQILLWGRYPGTARRRRPHRIKRRAARGSRATTNRSAPRPARCPSSTPAPAWAAAACRRAKCARTASHADPIKSEGWLFPASFVREQLHAAPGAPSGARHHRRQHGADHRLGRARHHRYRAQDADARRALRHPRYLRQHRRQAPANAAFVPADRG